MPKKKPESENEVPVKKASSEKTGEKTPLKKGKVKPVIPSSKTK